MVAAATCLALSSAATAQDFTPGRPGFTDSPIPVALGGVQLETEIAAHAESETVATLGFGLTHLVTSEIQVDANVASGLTNAAEPVLCAIGFARRS